MTIERLDYETFAAMMKQGANYLSKNVKMVDALNVFPVPDGDTGTNMNLSIASGVKQLLQDTPPHVGRAAASFAKGLLMGARGNSGVILSQLFRGFAKSVETYEIITAEQFAMALNNGVETAYKAVMKPVEGTILTVAKDAALQAKKKAKKTHDLVELMEDVIDEASRSLKRTPDLLPVLKEVGVVDSGGQGLLIIYQGFLSGLTGNGIEGEFLVNQPSMEELVNAEHHFNAQSFLKTEDIKYGYCTEFMVRFGSPKPPFNEEEFRNELALKGDSLLVISDDELIKVHVHTEEPGHMLSLGQRFGELITIKIENMRQQHRNVTQDESKPAADKPKKKRQYGIVTVAMGDGIQALFKSIGADVIIQGGQTMNPSTEDLVKAIEETQAEQVIVLPNNSNIVMAANQAGEVVEAHVSVIPSKTIPQGLAAMLAFNPESKLEDNINLMSLAMERVKSGQITFAVRDTVVDGVNIHKDEYISIADGKIVHSTSNRTEAVFSLLQKMVDEGTEIITVINGEDVNPQEVNQIVAVLEEKYPEIEVEVHQGNQPIYSYILSVE